MELSEQEKLLAERARALDVFRPAGAMLTSEYLERKQEVIGVNRTDLEDILGFDGIAAVFGSVGMFFLSGAGWLLIDKLLEQPAFVMTPAIGICSVTSFAGVVFLGAAAYVHHMKRGRISRIFNETKKIR